MASSVSYARTIKTSKNFQSESVMVSCTQEYTDNRDQAYALAKEFVDHEIAALEKYARDPELESMSHSDSAVDEYDYVPTPAKEYKQPPKIQQREWNVVSPKALALLFVHAKKQNKVEELNQRYKERGIQSFKDKNNMTKDEFKEFKNWLGIQDSRK